MTDEQEIHIDEDAAKAGETSGHMRWVLGISLLAVIAILSVIWITGAATQGDTEEEITATGKMLDEVNDDSTDSIVSPQAETMEGAADIEAAISAAEADIDAAAADASAGPAE